MQQTITLLKTPNENDKLAPQARGILKALQKGKTVDRVEFCKSTLPKFIKTRQSPAYIFQFYRNTLVEEGYIKVAKVAATPTAKAAPKAKVAKASAKLAKAMAA